jgi:hypothetical protein
LGIVEVSVKSFPTLLEENSKGKHKFKFQDFVNDTEENAESKRLHNIAVLAKPSPESKVYVNGTRVMSAGGSDYY